VLPDGVRTLLQHMLLGGGLARIYSDLLRALDTRVRNGNYDAVIACVQREVPGLAHFITGVHPNVLILSLNGLGGELRHGRWLALPRLAGRLAGKPWIHPALYRPVDPARIRMAVFASESWRREAIRAGLPADVGRTIYFGLPDVPPADPPPAAANRLLWVGRLSREKGLHHFIEALPLIRRTRPVTLTAVCGEGPEAYRHDVQRRIDELGLREAVELRRPVKRHELPRFYRSHDALLFHSVFNEPVALVMAEAFAWGIPVIASAPREASAILVPGETALCFETTDPASIATCVLQMLEDDGTRLRLRAQARDLVRQRLSLDVMAAAYDDALRELLQSAAA
jgi:glycosyltransferase involved in cell wall biosynthesis